MFINISSLGIKLMLVAIIVLESSAGNSSSSPPTLSANWTPPCRQYMVLVPSLLHSETPEKGCLLLSYLNETVTVSASLESLRENKSLFTDLVVEKDLFHCVSFTVSMPV